MHNRSQYALAPLAEQKSAAMALRSARSHTQSGRLHRRIPLTVPVKLLNVGEPPVAEDGVTENVSPRGVRVLVKTPIEPNALLLLRSPAPRFRTSVRVVYCEPISGGQFGLGLELEGPSVNWSGNPMDAA
jgi:PilZ domain